MSAVNYLENLGNKTLEEIENHDMCEADFSDISDGELVQTCEKVESKCSYLTNLSDISDSENEPPISKKKINAVMKTISCGSRFAEPVTDSEVKEMARKRYD